ncbi:MAG: PAS domain S-box protein [Bacteroidota bacterium]|nr:PAS domain S-box protein [Bacteroidota bacterium]
MSENDELHRIPGELEKKLKKQNAALKERVKELSCLNELSEILAKPDIEEETRLKLILDLIPPAYQYPDITCARILINNKEYSSLNFRETSWKLSAPIIAEDKRLGSMEVYYLIEKAEADIGPFLNEERDLLETIVRYIGQYFAKNEVVDLLTMNKQRLLEAQRIAKMGDFIWNVQTGEVQWSEAMYDLLGCDRNEKINFGKVNADIHHPDDLERVIDWLNQCIESGEEHHEPLEYRVIRKDGKVLEVQTHARVKYVDGQAVELFGVLQDVTKRKLAKEQLAQSHELMRYIIENTNSAVAIHDRDLRYIYVSQRYLNEYKISGQDVIGKHHYDVFPDLPEKWRKVHQRALRGEVLSAERDPYHRADGTVEWTRWECRPWYETEGSIGGIIFYTEVISELIESEMKLKEYNKKLEQAEENARLGSWEYDLKTGSTWWSKQMFKLLGFEQSVNAPAFEKYLDHIHPDDRQKISTVLENIEKGVLAPSIEYRGNPDYTGQRYLLLRAAGVKDQKSENMKITGTVLDITDLKLAENELNMLKEKLEGQVKEKTHELQERIAELERFRDATVEREFRMKELREEIEKLNKKNNV